jgi:hypothetical protein
MSQHGSRIRAQAARAEDVHWRLGGYFSGTTAWLRGSLRSKIEGGLVEPTVAGIHRQASLINGLADAASQAERDLGS